MFRLLTRNDVNQVFDLMSSNTKWFKANVTEDFQEAMARRNVERLDNANQEGVVVIGYFDDENILQAFVRFARLYGPNLWGMAYYTTRKETVFPKTYGSKTADVIIDIVNFATIMFEAEGRYWFYSLESTDPVWEDLPENEHCLLNKYYRRVLSQYAEGERITPENGIINLYNSVCHQGVQLVEYNKYPPMVGGIELHPIDTHDIPDLSKSGIIYTPRLAVPAHVDLLLPDPSKLPPPNYEPVEMPDPATLLAGVIKSE